MPEEAARATGFFWNKSIGTSKQEKQIWKAEAVILRKFHKTSDFEPQIHC
jgi:hypothetical protein